MFITNTHECYTRTWTHKQIKTNRLTSERQQTIVVYETALLYSLSCIRSHAINQSFPGNSIWLYRSRPVNNTYLSFNEFNHNPCKFRIPIAFMVWFSVHCVCVSSVNLNSSFQRREKRFPKIRYSRRKQLCSQKPKNTDQVATKTKICCIRTINRSSSGNIRYSSSKLNRIAHI